MIKTSPLVSVVIPTFNRSKFVVKAIDSVLSQSFTGFELIVVDDGSTDNTKSMLKSCRDRIRYIYQNNAGVSAARNSGIEAAVGEWVAFLDSDDEWTEDYLAKQIAYASDFPRVTMQSTNCTFIGLDGGTRSYFEINRALARVERREYLFLDQPFCFVVQHGPWQLGSTIIRRKAILEAGLFDSGLSISEDFDLMARAALTGPFGLINEELVIIYRRQEAVACLTYQVAENPVESRLSDERMLEKLRQIEGLSYTQRKALRELLSANRRALGNLFLEASKIDMARQSYRNALWMAPLMLSLGKYILSLFPEAVNRGVNQWYLRLKHENRNP